METADAAALTLHEDLSTKRTSFSTSPTTPDRSCASRRARWPYIFRRTGIVPVKLGLADSVAFESAGVPGTVMGSDEHGLLVSAGSGCLRVRRLPRPGGRMLGGPDFLRGHPVPAGTLIPSHPMAPLRAVSPFRR